MTATISWLERSVRVALPGGTIAARPGFVSTASKHLAIALIDDPIWSVTHVPTGWALAKHFQTRAAAMAFLAAIADLVDWSTDSVTALQADEPLECALRRLRAHIHAREESGEFGPVDHDMIAELNRFSTRLEEIQPTRELAQKMRARHHRPAKQ